MPWAVVMLVLGCAFFYLNVLMIRWIFKVDMMLETLKSIDDTLKDAPWMRPQYRPGPPATVRRAAP